MVTIHSKSKDGRFMRLSFVAPAVVAGAAAGSSSLTPALISAGGSILAGGLGALAGGMSASKYLKGVRETNEANLQLAREQRDWDFAQWQRENEYNSASAQLERWQAAGLSPQSFVGTPGEAAALQSPTMANQVAPGDLSGYSGLTAQSIQQGISGATKSALDWKQMEINQQQLNLDKERLANQTKETQSHVDLNSALTKQALANMKYLEKLTEMSDEQKWKFRAETDLLVQKWEQLAKLFPSQYNKQVAEAELSKLNKILFENTMDQRIEAYALANNKTKAEVRLMLKQAIYWLYQGKEGEFQVTLQPLRFDLLNWQQQQAHFDLSFSKDTRYSQLRFENAMKGIHAFTELGNLVVHGVSLLNPAHINNYNFYPNLP